jgi:hypothetical protein
MEKRTLGPKAPQVSTTINSKGAATRHLRQQCRDVEFSKNSTIRYVYDLVSAAIEDDYTRYQFIIQAKKLVGQIDDNGYVIDLVEAMNQLLKKYEEIRTKEIEAHLGITDETSTKSI